MTSENTVTAPKVGQWLYASCSGEDYGQVVAVGEDANGRSTIDIAMESPDDLVDCECAKMGKPVRPGEWQNPLTRLEVPEGIKLTLRDVQYRMGTYEGQIVCNTPTSGCYRCVKLFTLRDEHTDWGYKK